MSAGVPLRAVRPGERKREKRKKLTECAREDCRIAWGEELRVNLSDSLA